MTNIVINFPDPRKPRDEVKDLNDLAAAAPVPQPPADQPQEVGESATVTAMKVLKALQFYSIGGFDHGAMARKAVEAMVADLRARGAIVQPPTKEIP